MLTNLYFQSHINFNIPSCYLENVFMALLIIFYSYNCFIFQYPIQVLDDELGQMWYKKDNSFKMPKGETLEVSIML